MTMPCRFARKARAAGQRIGGTRESVLPSSRHLAWPILVAAMAVLGGCVDLTLPPMSEDSGVDAIAGHASGGTSAAGGMPGTGGTKGDTTVASGGASGNPDSGMGGKADAEKIGTGGGSGGRSDAMGGRDGKHGDLDGSTDGTIVEPARDAAVDAPADAGADAAVDVLTDTNTLPTRGLVAYYPCDNADGTNLPDDSGNRNHGLLQAATSDGYSFKPGKVGNALSLSKAGSAFVSLPVPMFRDSAEITVATWIRLETLTAWQRLFDVGINANLSQNTATGTAYVTLFLKDFSNKIGLSSTKDGFGSAQQVAVDALATGVWKHVAVVLGGGSGTIYVDGNAVAMASGILSPQALGAVDYAFIGKSQFSGDPFIDAQIDEFRVYDRALSTDEIQSLFKAAVESS
jgi:hypothetical protein